MASDQIHSFLLPLAPLTILTATAFAQVICSGWTDFSSIWTRCASRSAAAAADLIFLPGRLQSTVCSAVAFFSEPLAASLIARLEQAAIVGLLAGLATVTAVEATSALTRKNSKDGSSQRSKQKIGRSGDVSGDRKSSGSGTTISTRIVESPTIPWLLYQLAMGAFCWLSIIVPAAITHHHQQEQQRQLTAGQNDTQKGADAAKQAHSTLAIPLSITLGLLLPSALLLVLPTSTPIVLIWLIFPIWISLTQRLLSILNLPKATDPILYTIPVLWSAAAHALLSLQFLAPHLIPSTIQTLLSPVAAPASPTAVRSSMLLLEVDHAAILATYLYWLLATTTPGARTRVIATSVVSTLLLGPGAGVCIGWWSRGAVSSSNSESRPQEPDGAKSRRYHQQEKSTLSKGKQRSGRQERKGSGSKRRRGATGTFFAGPDALQI